MKSFWTRARRAGVSVGVALLLMLVSGGPQGTMGFGPSAAHAADLNAEGRAAVTAWMGALVKGDPAAIGAILAPEFQIMRSDGNGYGKAAYLKDGLPKIAKMPEVTKLVATCEGDLLVTRYMLTVDEVINGKPMSAHAPRLTVFRKSGDKWLVVAHGNFAQIEK